MNHRHPYRTQVMLLNVATVTLAVYLSVNALIGDLGYGVMRARKHLEMTHNYEDAAVLEQKYRNNATLKFVSAGELIVNACVLGWLTEPRRRLWFRSEPRDARP